MFLSRLFPRRRPLASFASDKSGTAAIEFALIAPIAVVMLLASVEYSRAVVMSRRFNLMAASLGDLVARDDYETDSTMSGLTHAMQTMWSPYDASTLKLQVVAVRKATSSATKVAPLSTYVYWERAIDVKTGGVTNTRPVCDPYTGLPTGMLAAGGSTIIVNGSYTFKTLFGASVPGFTSTSSNWVNSTSHSPRNLCVAWGSANCSQSCE